MDYEPIMDLKNFDFSQKLNDLCKVIHSEYELHFTKITKSANKGSIASYSEDPEKPAASRKGRKPK